MVKISLTFIALFFICSSASVHSQTINEEWENIISQANETAIYNNGKLVSLEQTIPGIGDKLFTFTHSENGKPLTVTDENGISLYVSFYKDSRIQSVEMPDGEILTVDWNKNSSNVWIAENLNCGNNATPRPPSNPCRDALVSIGVAAYVCANYPGSVGCWAATAKAGYDTYRCYESTRLAANSKKIRTTEIYAINSKFNRKAIKETGTFKKSKELGIL